MKIDGIRKDTNGVVTKKPDIYVTSLEEASLALASQRVFPISCLKSPEGANVEAGVVITDPLGEIQSVRCDYADKVNNACQSGDQCPFVGKGIPIDTSGPTHMYSPIIQSLSWDTDSSEFFPLEKPGDSARLMRHIRLPKEMYLPFTQFSEVDIDNNKALLEGGEFDSLLELADPDKIYSLHSERYDVEMPDDLNGKIEPFKKNAPFDTLTEARDKHPEQVARDVELYKIGAVNSLIKAETNQNKSRWGVPSRYYPNYDPINKEIACRTRGMLALVNGLRQDKNILSAEDQAAYIELLIKNIDYRIAGEYFPRIRKIAASTILYILGNQVFSDDSLMDKVNQLAQTGRCTSDEA